MTRSAKAATGDVARGDVSKGALPGARRGDGEWFPEGGTGLVGGAVHGTGAVRGAAPGR
ncbi:hypothetical protein GCM10010389_24750 [Streptomyces echinoruber]|uniref:Uncharacterized protein n=1 Tax=Streptomyces echinoruber TaxID=68898 RepID=A0A918VB66_9ACTN|nr:hypothetical protein GCM10010389_24750 [Streptomyces echinoruber]